MAGESKMRLKLQSVIVLAGISLAGSLSAMATEASGPVSGPVKGTGRITRIQAAPSVIVVDKAEYALPGTAVVLGPDKRPIGVEKLDVGMAIGFTARQPSTPGNRPAMVSIRILTD